jgi:hypothetical protein
MVGCGHVFGLHRPDSRLEAAYHRADAESLNPAPHAALTALRNGGAQFICCSLQGRNIINGEEGVVVLAENPPSLD